MIRSADLVAVTNTSTAYLAALEEKLHDFIEEQRRSMVSREHSQLWAQIAGAVRGGKRTRPVLVNLGHQAFGGGEFGPSVHVGCAFELLQTGLIIHDDVIDRDFVRRGRPTLSAHYHDAASRRGQNSADAEHVGHSAAIIAGDLLISQAIRLLYHGVSGTPS